MFPKPERGFDLCGVSDIRTRYGDGINVFSRTEIVEIGVDIRDTEFIGDSPPDLFPSGRDCDNIGLWVGFEPRDMTRLSERACSDDANTQFVRSGHQKCQIKRVAGGSASALQIETNLAIE
jgi:hypothetical protein